MNNIKIIQEKDILPYLVMKPIIKIMEDVFQNPDKGQMPPKIYLELCFNAISVKLGEILCLLTLCVI